jgi:hypothetical protein
MRHVSLGTLLVFALGSTPIFARVSRGSECAFSAVTTVDLPTLLSDPSHTSAASRC